MKMFVGQMWRLALITVLGGLGSMIAGLMRYGGTVFTPTHIAFAFVSFGLSGAFIFAFYHVRGLSNSISAALSVGVVQFIGASFRMPVLYSAVWSLGVNLPVVALAFVFERKLSTLRQWKFIVVGVIYGAMFVLLTLLVAALTGVTTMPAEIFRDNFYDGLLLGIGLGAGVEIAESFIHSVEQHREIRKEQTV